MTHAQAQSAGSESNEIIVTANKREENLNKVGLTITAITADALTERKVSSVEDIANTVPGLSFSPSATNTPILTLRGVGFNEYSLGVYPAVTVYIDQAPLVFPALTSHSAFDLQRVEVLKGPQGTLFGQNSTGGAINYIAARPTDTFEVGGDISYSRFNMIEGNAHISGPITEGLNGRLALTGANSDGWQRSSRHGGTNGAQSYIAGRMLLDWDNGSPLRLQLNVNGWRDKSEPQAQQVIAIHEGVTTDGTKPPETAPAVNDPLRNTYSPVYTPGATSAQLSYPFGKLDARTADWSTLRLDPNTATVQLPGGASDPTTAGYTNFTPRANRRMWQAFLRADLDVTDDITITSLTSYVNYKQRQVIDNDGMELVGYDFDKADGTIKSFNQELRIGNSGNNPIRWLVGTNYEDSRTFEDLVIRYIANGNYSPANFYINASGDRLRQKIRNYAFFGSLEYDVTPQLTLKASARYTNSRIRARNASYSYENGNLAPLFNILGGLSGLPFDPITNDQSYTLNSLQLDVDLPSGLTIFSPIQTGNLGLGVPGIPFVAQLKEDNVSWRVGVDYKATPDILLYANVSRGYKAGSFPTAAAASYSSLLPVTQEKVTSYEAGIKASMADGLIQFNAAGFYMDYRDKQVRGKLFDLIFGTIDLLVNVPKSRIMGAEAELTLRPADGLTLTGAVTYLDTKIQKYTGYDIFGGLDNPDYVPGGNNVEDLSGNPLPYTPKWSGVINGDYKFSALGGRPFIGVTMKFRSKQDAAIGGGVTTLPDGPRYRVHPGVGKHPYVIDAYATVDARAGFEAEDGSWRVMIWGKNIFDKYYWTAVVPSSDSSARLTGKPATYGVTVGFKM
ncbi:TonB-dependent receptor [Novosphingobium colocasiae]|uniref:TonB-dependent receptor n=1 Tax=Novosphingobium colocasiae TaxID=1256513 RepID=UPI001E65657C|nr:TonB-dependent receptor [Novosphingobium colocasiae]